MSSLSVSDLVSVLLWFPSQFQCRFGFGLGLGPCQCWCQFGFGFGRCHIWFRSRSMSHSVSGFGLNRFWSQWSVSVSISFGFSLGQCRFGLGLSVASVSVSIGFGFGLCSSFICSTCNLKLKRNLSVEPFCFRVQNQNMTSIEEIIECVEQNTCADEDDVEQRMYLSQINNCIALNSM